MSKIAKYSSYVQYLLFAITLVYMAMFYLGDVNEDSAYPHPVATDAFLNWGIILFFITVVITFLFEVYHIVMNPRSAVRTLASLGIILVIVLIAYALADDTPLHIIGYNGPDNVPSMLKMSGTMLYTMYILFGITLVVILYTELSRVFK
ncbi:MAG: hypothetical protein GXO47_06995 [Chlorobi bacterium]|nr:hypothetical protein [Chlorobiota bacterium]